ncbi:MAG: GNAT family N-acetyltransferase [Anaerolineae bacterium]
MDYLICLATIDDYEGICAILATTDAIHHASEPAVFRPSSESARPRALIEQQLVDPDWAIYVAADEQRIIGVLFLTEREISDHHLLKPRRYAMVDTLAVAEGWRSHGIGHRLMKQAETWATERGITDIELSVWEFNQRAFALYEKLGYRTKRRYMSKGINK